MMKGLTMIENIDIAYCMAKLEDRIRREWISAKNYLDYCSFVRDCNAREMSKIAALGVEDPVYERIIARREIMIYAFEVAFGVDYL